MQLLDMCVIIPKYIAAKRDGIYATYTYIGGKCQLSQQGDDM